MKKIGVKQVKALILAVVMVFAMNVGITKALALGNAGTGWYLPAGSGKAALVGISDQKINKSSLSIGPSLKIDGKTHKVTVIKKNAFKGAKAKTISLPKTVTKIEKQAFNGEKCKKTLTVKIRSTKLKKSSVKGCFKGAKAKKIVVKVPKKKLKAYKKIFTKKNTGAKGKVVVKAL